MLAVKKDLFASVFVLMLAATACQAPVQVPPLASNQSSDQKPVVSSPGPVQSLKSLSRQEYGQQFNSLFREYSKVSSEGTQTGARVLGAVNSFPVPVLNSPPTPSVSSGISQPTSVQEPVTDFNKQYTDLMIGSLEAQQQSLLRFETKIKALVPPPELSEKHQRLLAYFSEAKLFTGVLLQILKSDGVSILTNSRMFLERYREDIIRLQKLQAPVMDYLFELNSGPYRQTRLALQQGPEMSETDYRAKLQELKYLLPNINSVAMTMVTMIPVSGGDGTDVQRIKASMEEALNTLSRLHPPASLEAEHTAHYALGKIALNVSDKLTDLLKSVPQSDLQNPSAFTKLFSHPELIDLFTEMSIYSYFTMPELRELPAS